MSKRQYKKRARERRQRLKPPPGKTAPLTMEILEQIYSAARQGGEVSKLILASDLTQADRKLIALEAQGLAQVSQRWKDRHALYKPAAGERFEASKWEVRLFLSDVAYKKEKKKPDVAYKKEKKKRKFARLQDARQFVYNQHYLVSFPQVIFAYGLYQVGTNKLHAVAVYSNSMKYAPPTYGKVPNNQTATLTRLVMLPAVKSGGESWFVAHTVDLLRTDWITRRDDYWKDQHPRGKLEPKPLRLVISFSDPIPRIVQTAEGPKDRMPGHIGGIYQAGNADYLRPSPSKDLYLTSEGIAPDNRAISKARSLGGKVEDGAEGALKNLIRNFGQGTIPMPGQCGRGGVRLPSEFHAWGRTVRQGRSWKKFIDDFLHDPGLFEKVLHPGNLTYVFLLAEPGATKTDAKRQIEKTRAQLQACDSYTLDMPWEDVVRYVWRDPKGSLRLHYPKRRMTAYISLLNRYWRAFSKGKTAEALLEARLVTLAWDALSVDERAELDSTSQYFAPPTDLQAVRMSCAIASMTTNQKRMKRRKEQVAREVARTQKQKANRARMAYRAARRNRKGSANQYRSVSLNHLLGMVLC